MKRVNIIPRKAKRNLRKEVMKNGFADIRGELEVMAHDKNGKLVHYEKGDNVVTIWAKHATMHLLSGESFSTWGTQRLFDTDNEDAHTATGTGEGTNYDGTLLSGQQYFSSNSNPNFDLDSRWSKSTINPSQDTGDQFDSPEEVKYPFFPSKMIFGTGFEFRNWAEVGQDYPEYQQAYSDDGWDEQIFDENVENSDNDYSNDWTGSELARTRSMNDIFAGSLTDTIDDDVFGIPGAVKNGLYTDSEEHRHSLNDGGTGTGTIKTMEEGGNEFLLREWQGIGSPCFIYARRESRFFESGTEVALTADADIENKITFTVVMPEQTGSEAGIFYPYNGYTLKVAGLFCDARLLLQNSEPTGSGDDHPDELDNFNKMPYGMMYARRNISPIEKSHDISISSRWTLYL